MHPQDIKAGQGAVQLMQNALQNQAQAQDRVTQAFDRLSENAFNFAKYFENKQRYKEDKEFRDKAFQRDEQRYQDEKAYREQRDNIADERYKNEFNENARRWNKEYKQKQQSVDALTHLQHRQAQGTHINNAIAKSEGANRILANAQYARDMDDIIGRDETQTAQTQAMASLTGGKAIKDEKDKRNKIGIKTNVTLNSTGLNTATNKWKSPFLNP